MIEVTLLASFVVAFVAGLIILYGHIKTCERHGVTSRDMHKPRKVMVAEFGGVGLVLAFVCGVFAFVGLSTFVWEIDYNFTAVFAAICSILIVFIVGVFDDLLKIKWRTKMFLPVIAAVPLMAVRAGDTFMVLPLIGGVELGLLYIFILLPIGITGAANAVNMIAGYNGLEAGVTLVMSICLAFIAWDAGCVNALLILIPLIGALLAFLRYNWYPAKVFPGDTGTLVMGAAIASAVILGNMEKYGLLLFSLHFINLVIFTYGVGRRKQGVVKFAKVNKQGILQAPKSFWKYYLPYVFIKWFRLTEKQLVKIFIALEIVVATGVILTYFAGM